MKTKKSPRNPIYVAMMSRFGGKGGVMRDRRADRGGAKNKQKAFLSDKY